MTKLFVKLTFTLFVHCVLVLNVIAQEKFSISNEPPMIPIGLDAYRMWDRLPYHKIGIRAYMRSTYDRKGNNVDNVCADASYFLYQQSENFNVTLDVKGQGVLYFKRTNHFHGSPWHYEVDGVNTIVKETATDDPVDAKNKFKQVTFIPQELFPNPLTYTWEVTKGADLMWVPLAFEDSLRIAYSRTFYGTGYYIYHMIPRGTRHLSRPLATWEKKAPDQDVLDLINRSGTDIVPDKTGMKKVAATISLSPHKTVKFGKLPEGKHIIRSFKLKIPVSDGFDFGQARLRITWDKNWHPSIDAPIGLFFGAGELHNAENKEYLVKGFPLNVKYDKRFIYLDCYWPMPYFENALFEIQDRNGKAYKNISYEIYVENYNGPDNHLNYFHATYSEHKKPEYGKDVVFLDTKVTEGGGDWSGHFVGMSWIFSREGVLSVLEGDPRFFFDDSKTPQAMGTGSEEWAGGGDYWGGETMTIPFAGHPIGKPFWKLKEKDQERDKINAAYRFLIADYFPFGKRAVIGLEHGGNNNMSLPMSGVVYWYGVNEPSLILTDELNVCNAIDRERHNYQSPTACECYSLVSRYEWGPDTDVPQYSNPKDRKEDFYESRGYFFAEEDSVRIMRGTTQFTAKILEDNHGVMIRRKFDYHYPNQKARVYVKRPDEKEYRYIDTWYTAGSNNCVYSEPKGKIFTEVELAPSVPVAITSNRRWREEEFVIASKFTRGTDKIDIKLEFVPDTREMFPGHPFPDPSAWSESRYWVYSYVMPGLKNGTKERSLLKKY
jgi:hypothetical protein